MLTKPKSIVPFQIARALLVRLVPEINKQIAGLRSDMEKELRKAVREAVARAVAERKAKLKT